MANGNLLRPEQKQDGFLGRPGVARTLLETGIGLLGAGAPSLDPRAGSLSAGLAEGLARASQVAPQPSQVGFEDKLFGQLDAKGQLIPGTQEFVNIRDRANIQEARTKGLRPIPQGKGGVTVNLPGQVGAFTKQLAKENVATIGNIRKSAGVGADIVTVLNQQLKILNKGLETGAFAPTKLKLGRVARALGQVSGVPVDIKGLAPAEQFNALSRQTALFLRNPDSGGGLTGNTSDRDVAFLMESAAGLEKTPEGNRAILNAMREKFRQRVSLNQSISKWLKDNSAILDTPAGITSFGEFLAAKQREFDEQSKPLVLETAAALGIDPTTLPSVTGSDVVETQQAPTKVIQFDAQGRRVQ